MAYYLILSRGTYGRYKASTSNVVRLLTGMSREALVSVCVHVCVGVKGGGEGGPEEGCLHWFGGLLV